MNLFISLICITSLVFASSSENVLDDLKQKIECKDPDKYLMYAKQNSSACLRSIDEYHTSTQIKNWYTQAFYAIQYIALSKSKPDKCGGIKDPEIIKKTFKAIIALGNLREIELLNDLRFKKALEKKRRSLFSSSIKYSVKNYPKEWSKMDKRCIDKFIEHLNSSTTSEQKKLLKRKGEDFENKVKEQLTKIGDLFCQCSKEQEMKA